uniref:SDR family oxidoreductase n=1 Tax=Phenylobacterium glaciei TaxID=2803784 RepID=A0A974P5J1_9CAUL|nr:SDR family oxidoreductase [Phenylobacterium glaciei]
MIYPTTLLGADLVKFRQAVETNGLSLLYLVHAAQALLGRGSSVVFITSMGSRIPSPNYGALGVGKALAEAIVRYLVAELAPRGIRINGVAPGLVHTTSVAAMLGSEDAAQAAVDRAARTNPSGRESRDSDYAALVEFLLGPEAEFIQGQVIAATGGQASSARSRSPPGRSFGPKGWGSRPPDHHRVRGLAIHRAPRYRPARMTSSAHHHGHHHSTRHGGLGRGVWPKPRLRAPADADGAHAKIASSIRRPHAFRDTDDGILRLQPATPAPAPCRARRHRLSARHDE